MGDIKKPVNNSLRRRLSIWLSLAILSMAIIAGIWSYYSALNDAHEFQDDMLRQIAVLFDQNNLVASPETDPDDNDNSDPADRFFVQLLSSAPALNSNANPKIFLAFPATLINGFQTVSINTKTYRVFVKSINKDQRLAVAQAMAVRDEIAQWSSVRALIPLLILVPILLLGAAHLIRTLFNSVADITKEIDRRGEHEFYPIVRDDLPVEIQPFIAAINRLFGRVEQSMDAQRRFVADAAHELRSPLTALSLQVERLADAEMSTSAQVQVDRLRQGIARSRALLNQLLALAHSQVAIIAPETPVSVQQIYRRVLEDLMPTAEQKNIDIGVTGKAELQLLVSEGDLTSIVKNLVDNAIRYTPVGGRVDLSAVSAESGIVLIIEDNGAGIPESERNRVFDPFYRILGNDEIGSGLGLSIVLTIATRIGATVNFDFTNQQLKSGLKVNVTFPKKLLKGK
jgi:two-component system OmpR family sensor kinase